MYQKFYNLTKEPFHITPNPEFLYLSESHKQALASMIYGIEKRKGFIAITGGVGVGKTTIVRAYLEKAKAASLRVIYVFQANITFKDLVRTIYREFDLELATNNLVEMVNGLHLALIELFRQGKTVVIIIDEAQNMPIETLENLRMLSNLETPTEKLVQVVLVGQAELDGLLEKHELRQLKQRIAIRARILPLSAEDSRAYIEHRLSVAGLNDSSIFDKRALDIIIKEGAGIPRKLNVLCDNALITGFGYQKNPVTTSIAREVIADFASPRTERRPVRRRYIPVLIVLTIFVALVIALLYSPYSNRLMESLGVEGFSHETKPEPVRAAVNKNPEANPQGTTAAPALPVAPAVPVAPPVAAAPAVPVAPTVSAPPAVPAPAKQPSEANEKEKKAAQPQSNVKTQYKIRVVKEGETLANLIREVYGISTKASLDPSIIKLVKQHNPMITDSNLIIAGSVIQFPNLPRK
ncbi:MAG TPA: AAA family ATPase [Syntrophorhabdales bacterium]|nr:AAA family ATPase [Syntrophorhabdales bacterium]